MHGKVVSMACEMRPEVTGHCTPAQAWANAMAVLVGSVLAAEEKASALLLAKEEEKDGLLAAYQKN